MKRRHRLTSLLLPVCLILGMLPSGAFAAEKDDPFTDVSNGDWYEEAVEFVQTEGLMTGVGGGLFQPDGSTTRGMVVTILWRMAGSPAEENDVYFSDVAAGSYYENAIQWAVGNSVAEGYGGNRFGPDDPVTREQMAVFLYRQKGEPEISKNGLADFRDEAQVSIYALDAMAWGVETGLLTGMGNGLLQPQGTATRAQMAMVLMRLSTLDEQTEEETPQPSLPSGGGTDGGQTPEEPEENDGSYAITGLELVAGDVSAMVSTTDACTLKVTFLDEEGNEMLGSTTADAGADLLSGTVTAPLPGGLSAYFLMQADLLDENGEKLCATYVSRENTRAYEAFEEKTPQDFAGDIVVNVVNNGGFGVLAEGTEEVSSANGENVLENWENGVYTVQNPGTEFEILQPGDILYLPDAPEEHALVKVGSVTVSNGEAVIIADPDAVLSDFYQYLRVDVTVALGEPESRMARRAAPPTGGDGEKLELELGPVNAGPFSASGKGSAEVTVAMTYDVELFGEDYFLCEMAIKTELTAELSLSTDASDADVAKLLDKEELAFVLVDQQVPMDIPGMSVGGRVSFPLKFKIEGGLSVTSSTTNRTGISYSTDSGYQPIKERTNSVEPMLKGKGSISFGPEASLNVQFLDEVVKAEVGTQGGVKAEGESKTGGHIADGDYYHACDSCIKGEVSGFAEAYLELSYHITEKLKGTVVKVNLPVWEKKLKDFYYSVSNEADSVFGGQPHGDEGECPNKKYRITFNTVDANGETVNGTQVQVTGKNTVWDVGASPCSDYFYPGSYTAEATVNGSPAEQDFTVADKAMTVTLKGQNATLYVTVTDGKTGKPVSGAAITVLQGGTAVKSMSADGSGEAVGALPYGDNYLLKVAASGYKNYSTNFSVDQKVLRLNVSLTPENEDAGTLSGTVYNATTGAVLPGVAVQAWQEDTLVESAASGEDGAYTMALPAGEYTLKFSAAGFAPYETAVTVTSGGVTEQDARLNQVSGSLAVTVTDGSSGEVLPGATVEMTNQGGSFSGISGEDGVWIFDALPEGTYDLKVTMEEKAPYQGTVTVTGGDELERTVTLYPGGTCGDTLYWRVEGTQLIIFGTGAMYDYNTMGSHQPWRDVISYKDVSSIVVEEGAESIGKAAFQFLQAEWVKLPSTLKLIDSTAFSGCTQLTSADIPAGVESIGLQAFYQCKKMESVTLHEGLKSIGQSAFNDCWKLTAVDIPATVETIDQSAFYACYDLEQVTLHEGLVTIGPKAFENCSVLKAIHMPDTVTSVGELAFKSCPRMAEVTLSSQLTVIPDSLFHNGNDLKEIVIPAGVTYIGDSAFSSCWELTSVDIPDGVTYIGELAFYNNTSLAQVHIPAALEELGRQAFYGCEALTGTLTLPAGVTSIGQLAFTNTGLSHVILSGPVASIGYKAFWADNLKEITYGGTVEQFSAAMGRDDDTDQYLGIIGRTIHCTDGDLVIPEPEE